MKEFGLIGKELSHSFSASYFNNKFIAKGIEAIYNLFDLDNISLFKHLLSRQNFSGLNVTSPYKREVIPFLNELSEEAKKINAINVIEFIRKDTGELILKGHNTDSKGFDLTLNGISDINGALILGTGGASSAVALALERRQIPCKVVSRCPAGKEISYDEMNSLITSHKLIINATPVGMYPKEGVCPDIDYSAISSFNVCYDLIYNPSETIFLKKSKAQGAKTLNGLQMLINQAELAWEIWNKNEREDT